MTEYKFRATPMFRQKLSTSDVMRRLTIGLLTVFVFGLWNTSKYGMEYVSHSVLMLVASLLGGVGTEVVYALVLKKNVFEYLKTSFPWITCLIITEIVPCDSSLYAVFVSSALAIFFGKLVFGGFGQNTFNPAAIGRTFITTSFVSVASVELIASATPAREFASVSWLMTPASFNVYLHQYGGVWNLFFGNYHGALGETSALLLFAILIIFLKDGVVDNRVPLTFLGVCFASAYCIGASNGLNGFEYAIAFISTGGLMYGAVFMLTDPVTSPFSVPGRMVFACVAAVVTCLIRFLGNLPEGMCYGILIANMLSPLIDKLFSCKQVDSLRKNSYITYGTIILSIVGIVLATSGLQPGIYEASESFVKEGQRPGIDYVTVEAPTDIKENGIIPSQSWASQYPEIVESYNMISENKYTVDYLEEDPYLVEIYEGYGFAKDYNSARGHTYVLEDSSETKRPHATANCLTCKTADFTALVNNIGKDAYSMSFNDVLATADETVGCYTCHDNKQGNEGQLAITHDYTREALGENMASIDMDTLTCGQCHTEYYFIPSNKATFVPYTSIENMTPEAELAYYEEIGFSDWTQPSTGAKLLKVQHPEIETYLNGSIHATMGLSCADCHMPTEFAADGHTYISHNIVSPLENATLLDKCATCHGDEDMNEKVKTLQSEVVAREKVVGNKLADLKRKLADANKYYSEEELEPIRKLYRYAQWFFDYDYVENSEGVHNSRVAFECLDKAEAYIEEAMRLFIWE